MQRNRWTTVCDCRATKCTCKVSGADKMGNKFRNQVGVTNKVFGRCILNDIDFQYTQTLIYIMAYQTRCIDNI